MCVCGHKIGWHLISDGPHPRICNHPQCKCAQYEENLEPVLTWLREKYEEA